MKIKDVISRKISGEWGEEAKPGDSVYVIRTANFLNNGKINFDDLVRREIDKGKVEKKKLIQGDTIIEKSGGSPKQPVGRVVFFEHPSTGTFLCNNFTSVLRPGPSVVPKYLFYHLHYNYSIGKTRTYQNKTTGIINMKLDRYLEEELLVPDLQTQQQIVEALDRAQSLIEKRKESIELLDELLQATFLDMFGKSNPDFDKWEEASISALALQEKGSMRTGPFGSNLRHSEFIHNGEVAVLGIDNAVDNTFKWKKRRFITLKKYENLKRYTVYPRDVIITIMGTLGRSAVIPEGIPLAINTKHLACITLDESKCNPFYLAYSIHSNPFITFQMKSRSRGAVMDGLNLGIIKDLKLKKAPIDLQNQFEHLYTKIEERKSQLIKSWNWLEELFQSLLQRAFHGDLSFQSELQLDALVENNDVEAITNDGSLIQELVDRFNQHNQKEEYLNDDGDSFSFDTFEEYETAKGILFQLMKKDRLVQKYDADHKQTMLEMK